MRRITHQKMSLTSAEIAALWTSYQNESMAVCVLSFFQAHAEDPDIRPIVDKSLKRAETNLKTVRSIMKEEEYVVPVGFTSEDVDVTKPKMFFDTFYLMYMRQMAKVGMLAFSGFLAMMVREDLLAFYKECLLAATELYELTTKVSTAKGTTIRPPFISVPTVVEFVENGSYLKGEGLLRHKRPLNAIEISHLFTNIETNLLGSMLGIAFAQSAQSKEVKDYLMRGKDIAQKHLKIFGDHLIDSDVQAPMSWDTHVSNMTEPGFSDKLIMFHMTLLAAAGLGNYGASASATMRADIAADYLRLAAEISLFAKDGADLMIRRGWMEQPPQASDRRKLVYQPT
ncbi:DUF3231 family protein [Paenibacillus caseinilyticus]|nr:DUF3231 family protein [Paenibacillus mucilaginosus]